MAEEKIFLKEGNVYVSNTKVVLGGTTYATANITSVTMETAPPSRGCAFVLIVAGGFIGACALAIMLRPDDAARGVIQLQCAVPMLGLGIWWYCALKPTHVVVLTFASGEGGGVSSKDRALVTRVIAAITDAITYRG